MSSSKSTEKEWLRWIEVQSAAAEAMMAEDLSGAIALIDSYLGDNRPRDLVCQAVGFRGSLFQEKGELRQARADFQAARELKNGPDFERFTLEHSAGRASLALGDIAEACRWFVRALKTARTNPRIGGAEVVVDLLKANKQAKLRIDERKLCEDVIKGLWRFHDLNGDPDLENLQSSSLEVVRAKNKPSSLPGD